MKWLKGRLLVAPKVTAEIHPRPKQMDRDSSAENSTKRILITRGGRGHGKEWARREYCYGQSNAIATLPGESVIPDVLKFNLNSYH